MNIVTSYLRAYVSPLRANLDAQYEDFIGIPVLPNNDDTLTMCPKFWESMPACVKSNNNYYSTLITFTSSLIQNVVLPK